MAGVVKKVLRASLVALIVPVVAFAVQQKNPRGSVSNARDNAYAQDSQNNAQIRRSATSVIARSVSANSRKRIPCPNLYCPKRTVLQTCEGNISLF